MKKWIPLLLAVLLLAGCALSQEEKPAETVNFYYPASAIAYGSEGSVIGVEARDAEALEGNLDQILELYFQGPADESLTSPFPKGTALRQWSIQWDTMVLTVSPELAELTGLKLSLACSCLTKTCLELAEVTSVRIFSGGKNLSVFPEKQDFSQENVILFDNSTQRATKTYTVYYVSQDGRYLIGEEASFSGTDLEICRQMVERLLEQSTNSLLKMAIPGGTSLLNVTLEDGRCILDFSPEFENGASWDPQEQRMTLLSIVNTLTQLPVVDSVSFCEEGAPLYSYRFQDISTAWVADVGAIGPVRTTLGELDADLYVPVGSQGLLAPVPVRVTASLETVDARRILETLLDYAGCNGYESAIAANVEMLALRVEYGIAQVDLSAQFLESADLTWAVRSVVTTLCALDGIDAVSITVAGAVPEGDYGDLFTVLEADAEWCY